MGGGPFFAGMILLLAASLGAADTPRSWRPFSADSPWNTRIPAGAASDRNSAILIDDLASRGAFHLNIKDWSIPVYFVDAERTPKHDVGDSRPGVFGHGFGFPRAIPIPDGAVASPPVGEHSDNHLCIVDCEKNLEWGMWAARKDAQGRWFTGLGAVTDLSGTGVAPPWFDAQPEMEAHRARAGGFPLIAGLVLREEIAAGRIDHALVFAYDHCRSGHFVPPASTAQVTQLEAIDTRGIPMGGRIQLDPAWDVETSPLSPAGKIIARALQEYGAYCGDYAGANVLYAENSPEAVAAWQGVLRSDEFAAVFTPDFIRLHFRVINMGDLLPGQNLHVPPPYLLRFSISGEKASVGIDQLARTVTISRQRALPTKAKISWRAFPKDCALTLDEKPLPEDEAELSSGTRLQLTAPDGRRSEWRVEVSD